MPRVRVAWDSSLAFIRRSEDAPRRVLPALKPQPPTPEEWDGHREQESSEAEGVALSAEAAAAAGMLSPRGRREGQEGGW